MEQLVQKLKNGDLKTLEVPIPVLSNNHHLLIKNHYSLISAGTENSTVTTARKGYIGKAKERPEQVKQVIQTLRSQGPIQTYRAVMKKLDSYSPLGYSCAGQVIDMAPDVKGFALGDYVACGGLTASHAEIVSVPANLCAKLKPDSDLKQAAYNTLGAIAMQGVRQANLRLGETCSVIGLGLLGQLTSLLLKASGVHVIGIDIDPAMVEIAAKNCADLALSRYEHGIEEQIIQYTDGLGCDAVIITAASSSLDPINFSGAICRKRGTVVVVGNVPTGFNREPHYYKKELQIKMSCSYGPGRYDLNYEEKGIDYPPAYVRWTENRNMRAFQALLHTKKINIDYLTTHTFKLSEAPAAYDMLVNRSEPFIGILIEYDLSKELQSEKKEITLVSPSFSKPLSTVNIGFIGAGSYAQGNLLPNIPKQKSVSLKGVLTSSGTSSRSVAERFGFEFCTSDEQALLRNETLNTVFIATRHDSHAGFVKKSLKSEKHVFVEKPLCLTEQELSEIFELLALSPGQVTSSNSKNDSTERQKVDLNNQEGKSPQTIPPTLLKKTQPILMVGFNRRFSPLIQEIKKNFPKGPMAMIYRINSGMIPADSWIQDPEIGGGRIIGEVCHFIDLLNFLNGSLPISVFAAVMKDPQNLEDALNISITYQNGSIGTISYLSNGDKSLPKERLEIFANRCSAILDDFKSLTIYANGQKKQKKLLNQDKGQKSQVQTFINAILSGSGSPIPLEEIYSASFVPFKIIESIRTGKCIRL